MVSSGSKSGRRVDGRHSQQLAPIAEFTWLFYVGLQLCLFSRASADEACLPSALLPLGLGSLTNNTAPLLGTHCDIWRLYDTEVQSTCPDNNADGGSYLLFEFWRTNGTDVETRASWNAYFLLARGTQPYTFSGVNQVRFSPGPASAPPYTGPVGTLFDGAAISNARPYHRILVPINSTLTPPPGRRMPENRDWFVTVAYMASSDSVVNYSIRVKCVKGNSVPCPQPSPRLPECSGNGTCGQLPAAATPRPELSPVCFCNNNTGDYGCQQYVRTLPLPPRAAALDSAIIDAHGVAYWQVSVPRPPPSSGTPPPVLLVEMSRTMVGPGGANFGTAPASMSGWNYGGDPMLMVMPKLVNDSNRVPMWSPNYEDFKKYGDIESWAYEQNLHFVMYRDLPLAEISFPSSPDGNRGTVEFYVAVVNYPPVGNNPKANVTIRVRYRTDPTVGSPLCPSDCFGRGTCFDPRDPSMQAALPAPTLAYPSSNALPNFQCACPSGFGGAMCEGRMANLTISTSGDGRSGHLGMGEWAFFVLNVDTRRFDYRANDVTIQWVVTDASGEPPSNFDNAMLMLDMQSFPRAPYDQGSINKAMLYSNLITQSSSSPQPLFIRGVDLAPGYAYVLSMYNSDYERQQAFDFSLTLSVPTSSRTWLHPYMSVVLGVTASIIICLLLTLCRRLVQRFGWGPFRNRDMDTIMGPNGARVQVGHMPARPRGVPGHIIDAFHSYEYTASKAEKQQLARSNRDHQQQQQQVDAGAAEGTPPGTVESGVVAPAAAAAVAPAPPPDGVVVEVKPTNVAVPAAAAAAGAAGSSAAASRPGTARAIITNAGPLGSPAAGAAAAAAPAEGAGAPSSAVSCPLTGSGGTSSSTGDDDEEPQCTVCLCEYEEGERITRLPCKHEFHCTCITKWLQTHYTCPICRVSLLPDEPEEAPAGDGAAPQEGMAATTVAGPAGVPAAVSAAGAASAATLPAPHGPLMVGAPAAPGAAAGAAVAPPPPPPPPQQQPARPGFFASIFGGRRQPPPPPPPVQNQMVPLQSPSGPYPQGPVAAAPRAMPPGGVSESLARVEPVSVGATQVIAMGPTATLALPPAATAAAVGSGSTFGGSSSGGGAGNGNRSPVSPSRRLASGRVAALPSAAWSVPPGADAEGAAPPLRSPTTGGWAGAPMTPSRGSGGGGSQGLRDSAVLPPPQQAQQVEGPGALVSPAPGSGEPQRAAVSRPGTAVSGGGVRSPGRS